MYKVLTKENLFGTTGKGELIRAKVEKLGDGWVELDREWEGSTRISFEVGFWNDVTIAPFDPNKDTSTKFNITQHST